jgi:hypothetical protein
VGRRHRPRNVGVEEAGESSEQRGRGGRGVSVEETGPSHLGSVGSGAEGSGPNAGVGSAASAGGRASARIRKTRAEHVRASGHAQPY